MNLTVAMKVIGGFAVSSLLLIVLGISSLISLTSIDSATNEVSDVAMPTVSQSANLETHFLNMGRLTFEAYISEQVADLKGKETDFSKSKEQFEATLAKLKGTVQNDKELKPLLSKVELIFNDYINNANEMYKNHLQDLNGRNQVASMRSTLEEQLDDASSLLLDFTDLDEVEDSAALSEAAQIATSLEGSLLSLMSSVADFTNVKTQQRAEIRQQEVDVFKAQTLERLSNMMSAANGQDDSGTLEEAEELITDAIDLIEKNNGIVSTKLARLVASKKAEDALVASDINIADGRNALDSLLNSANGKAAKIKEHVSSLVSGSLTFIVVLIIASVLAAGFIGFKSVMAIKVPLGKVNELLKIASSGDLTHRLDDSSTDEFGVLSKNCNQLIDNLKALIDGINMRADQLAAASGETSTITAQTTNSIEEQKSQISQIAAATTEMHSTSELVSQSADDTLKEIKNADAEAEKVKQISQENKHTIEVLARDVQDAADVINKLHQDSASIGGILDVIRGVADQTNLLALNAAIEAARAGEQGRGFAVVADEVRTLASRTQQSTQEINTMIEQLQAGAERAVSVMNQGRDQTSVCVEQTEKATLALDVITDAVHRAYEVSSRIEQAAREQHTVSSEISERLESIVGIAEETTLGAQQTTASSAEVAKLADELQESIGEFKV
ncbi:methyl-accepting chemotaxis protein [Glaciecola sp. KUL10]|uniref:HAMP domain-containing methyl-accepting chemotaxis protein n=1 Tax=Glaciecola sp. (strain KUL10) TaxID=2161813 RepID=UPI000D7884B3|nr:methyl-accepting chemotaxis protein [Glaciecola sp. KUL10]GBL06113.1 methyl-accepting chemotaxis protein [Glaciecola sp. KUL10]